MIVRMFPWILRVAQDDSHDATPDFFASFAKKTGPRQID